MDFFSIRYLIKPGVIGPGIPWHHDPNIFQALVVLQAPEAMQGGSLEIERRSLDPGGKHFTFSRNFGAESHNRFIVFGGQSNWHRVRRFDMRAMYRKKNDQ